MVNNSIIRRFYTSYGYFQAMSEFNLTDSFIQFIDEAYEIFASLGFKQFMEFEEIIDDVWEDEYNIRDDVDMIDIVEQIEDKFRNFIYD